MELGVNTSSNTCGNYILAPRKKLDLLIWPLIRSWQAYKFGWMFVCYCYRHFCALQHEAWNVNNLRDPKSLNMLFQPLEEQGQQTTATQISSPLKNTKKQVSSGSCQLLHWASALNVNCPMVHLRWMSKATKATCAERILTSGSLIPQSVSAQEASKMTLGSKNSPCDS